MEPLRQTQVINTNLLNKLLSSCKEEELWFDCDISDIEEEDKMQIIGYFEELF